MANQIQIKDFFPAYISSRKSIDILKSNVDYSVIGKDIVFDFSDIIFISRSFAHEFIQHIKTENLKAEIINTNKNISAMFTAVKNTETSGKRSFSDIPITSFKKKSELNSFFATI